MEKIIIDGIDVPSLKVQNTFLVIRTGEDLCDLLAAVPASSEVMLRACLGSSTDSVQFER